MTDDECLEAFVRGNEAGNYCEAYERSDLPGDEVIAAQAKRRGYEKAKFTDGFVLGFFASYETHEIPYEHRGRVESLRKIYCPED